VKHTDSIMKSIAVSGAIVLASVGGWFFLNGPMTLPMAVGSCVAIIASQNYTFDTSGASEPVAMESTKKGDGEAESNRGAVGVCFPPADLLLEAQEHITLNAHLCLHFSLHGSGVAPSRVWARRVNHQHFSNRQSEQQLGTRKRLRS
jgi:hypothetical protein